MESLVQGYAPSLRKIIGWRPSLGRGCNAQGTCKEPSRRDFGWVMGPLHSGTLHPDGVILLAPEPGLSLQGAEQALGQPWELPGGAEQDAFMRRGSPSLHSLEAPFSLSSKPQSPTPSFSFLPASCSLFTAVETRRDQITQFRKALSVPGPLQFSQKLSPAPLLFPLSREEADAQAGEDICPV